METATQRLHRLTSYESWDPSSGWDPPVDDPWVVRSFEPNDLSRLPWFYKRYPASLPVVPLPRSLPATTAPAVAVLAGTAAAARAGLDLPGLSRLLHLSAGVVRTGQRSYGTYLFRAAGSAGGRFPLEVYVAVPEGGGTAVPAGVHWYHPQEHALVQVGPPPQGEAPALVVTGVPWRTGWRYRERGYRHVYWDAGSVLAQALAAAGSAGLGPRLYSYFPDAAVSALVGADGVHEWPVAVLALGEGTPALAASGPAAAGQTDAAPVEFPLDTAAQRAGDRDTLGAPWDPGAPVDVPDPGTRPVEDVVLARGSQRRMDPARGLPGDLLRTSFAVALRGVDLPHRVVVHDVTGFAPGVYRWPDLSAPARPGALREELHRVCLGQALGRDAAFVAIAAADVAALDDRAYREAHLAAGVAEGRLHLVAYSCGASASGMTFLDAQIPALLGEPLNALLFTCVGVPEYASSAGGPPGAPTAVSHITPRTDD
jgi:SagB-type dehydrogenase family enzyme